MRAPATLGIALTLFVAACAQTSTATDEPGGSSRGSVAAPSGFPLVGSWTSTITSEDLKAAGFTDPGAVQENTGRFTWTFEADGTWRQTQVSLTDAPVLNPVFSGTFSVADAVLIVSTAFPEQYRDEGLHYTWQIAADGSVSFRLQDPPDPMLPAIVEAHPWQPTRE